MLRSLAARPKQHTRLEWCVRTLLRREMCLNQVLLDCYENLLATKLNSEDASLSVPRYLAVASRAHLIELTIH